MSDFLKYQGKVCVVTGAASGMGGACARILVELGAEVIGLDVQESFLDDPCTLHPLADGGLTMRKAHGIT